MSVNPARIEGTVSAVQEALNNQGVSFEYASWPQVSKALNAVLNDNPDLHYTTDETYALCGKLKERQNEIKKERTRRMGWSLFREPNLN